MHEHAKVTRQLREDHPFHFGFILLMAAQAAKKCKCGKLKCTACGFTKFHIRVRHIETSEKVKIGYLTGGLENETLARLAIIPMPSMLSVLNEIKTKA